MSSSLSETNIAIAESLPGEVFYIEIDDEIISQVDCKNNSPLLTISTPEVEVQGSHYLDLVKFGQQVPGKLFFGSDGNFSGDHAKRFLKHIKDHSPTPTASPFSHIEKDSNSCSTPTNTRERDNYSRPVSALSVALSKASPLPEIEPDSSPALISNQTGCYGASFYESYSGDDDEEEIKMTFVDQYDFSSEEDDISSEDANERNSQSDDDFFGLGFSL